MEPAQSVRVDKWLWAARVFKTRTLAADACDGGKVDVNEQAAKPAKALRPGDLVRVTLPQGRRRMLKVSALGDRRGPAPRSRAHCSKTSRRPSLRGSAGPGRRCACPARGGPPSASAGSSTGCEAADGRRADLKRGRPMESYDWNAIVDGLNRYLHLRSIPIGMKLFETVEEMEAIPKIRRPRAKHTTDQIVAQARQLGWTVGITMADLIGAQCGAVIGLHPQDEEWLSGKRMAGVWFKTHRGRVRRTSTRWTWCPTAGITRWRWRRSPRGGSSPRTSA